MAVVPNPVAPMAASLAMRSFVAFLSSPLSVWYSGSTTSACST